MGGVVIKYYYRPKKEVADMNSIFTFTTKEHVDQLLTTLTNFRSPLDYINGTKISAPLGVIKAHELYQALSITDPTEQLILSSVLGGVFLDCEQAFFLDHNQPWSALVKPVFWWRVLRRLYLNAVILAYEECSRFLVEKEVFPSADKHAVYKVLTDFYMELLQVYQPEFVEDFMFTASEYTP